MKATAEGRLYNHSPRLACLPGVSCGRINLPPNSGCINHVIYFSKLGQRPAIGSGVPPAREMGRMRRIPARIRFAPRTGLRKSAVAPRRCRCGDGISTTALRRFPSVDVPRSGGWHVYASCAICSSKRLRTSLVIFVFVLMIRKTLRYCLP